MTIPDPCERQQPRWGRGRRQLSPRLDLTLPAAEPGLTRTLVEMRKVCHPSGLDTCLCLHRFEVFEVRTDRRERHPPDVVETQAVPEREPRVDTAPVRGLRAFFEVSLSAAAPL